jgi:hypothetical protein
MQETTNPNLPVDTKDKQEIDIKQLLFTFLANGTFCHFRYITPRRRSCLPQNADPGI